MAADCRLSVIVTSRNDDHGCDMLKRFSIFADGLLEQAARFGLTGELIVVEWNPAPGPRLHQVLHFKNKVDRFPVRFIEVPPALHETLNNHDKLPLFQMIAKNVGIRRARGEFILATNPDLLFTDELIEFLAKTELDPRAMYRLDRIDISPDIPADCSHTEQIAFAEANVIRINARFGTFPRPTSRWPLAETAARLVRRGLRRRMEILGQFAAGVVKKSTSFARRSASNILAHLRGTNPRTFSESLHRAHAVVSAAATDMAREVGRMFAHELQSLGRAIERAAPLLAPSTKPHTNACGDFTLLSREAWLELRGYPELTMYSLHIDSFLCLMAVAAGYREIELKVPMKMFHIEHGRSWVVMDVEEKLQMFSRKPWLDLGLLNEVAGVMDITKQPLRFNGANWGFGGRPLDELVVGASAEETPTRA